MTTVDRRRALATLATWVAGAAGTVALPGCGGGSSSSYVLAKVLRRQRAHK